ncbi:endonuclease MutS2 [Anaerocolumna chitinilytica]|uniref:Endonuclease MutS2 n=1 Tax=Anaerocolumna chitinilytica TaxID=1727145 RepID=A0A7M3SA30_9FIRM|nr:DNA mismatch repair protein MutS [Anaerocolumna chitinilytica]BCK01448.1 endonuclease MutS2 [Anaerocolumna chitinilytica]
MFNKTSHILEFDTIKTMLCERAVSDTAKAKLMMLAPFLSLSEVKLKIQETTEAKAILSSLGTPPLPSMKDMDKYLELASIGSMLTPEQLLFVASFLTATRRVKTYLLKAEFLQTEIAYYGNSFADLTSLAEEVNRCLRNNQVDDEASKELKGLRRRMEQIQTEIRSKLENLLKNKKEWFSESFISTRNGHYVLPVKKEHKNQVSGSTVDISSTGSTCFMVPNSVLKLEDELSLLKIEEENEVRRILYLLTGMIADASSDIHLNMQAMETLDILFAKAKLSMDMKAIPALMNHERRIVIKEGRHPLLNAKECVPLDFKLGEGIQGVVITGPNTGGKTVALKTVGILSLMAQCGLHVPCTEAELAMNNGVFCDIGDGQSITENLSTFSSHITNIIEILKNSNEESLVLMDELGSGTDPAEGMGIAIAILEELRMKNCLFVATTHYPEVKDYAAKTAGLINARMAFDKESLKPLYRLEIGEAGESCALYIAKRLGFPEAMLRRAHQEAYERNLSAGLRSSSKKTSAEDSNQASLPTVSAPAASRNLPENSYKNADSPAIDSNNSSFPTTILPRVEGEKKELSSNKSNLSLKYTIGDSVMVYPQKKIGIVFQISAEKGLIGVQMQKKKEFVNHKRLKLISKADNLYPPDYDFSIVFDTVANRKARHKMEKGHQPDLEIRYDPMNP